MRQVVKTHLPSEDAPIEWATTPDGVLYTAQIPIYPGGTLGDVTQVLVYLTGKEHFAKMSEVYRRYFAKPFPNRATVIVAGLMVPDAVIEIVAYAHLGKKG